MMAPTPDESLAKRAQRHGYSLDEQRRLERECHEQGYQDALAGKPEGYSHLSPEFEACALRGYILGQRILANQGKLFDATGGPHEVCDYCAAVMTWDESTGWLVNGISTTCSGSPLGHHVTPA